MKCVCKCNYTPFAFANSQWTHRWQDNGDAPAIFGTEEGERERQRLAAILSEAVPIWM